MDLLDIEAETVRGGRVDMEYAHITFDDQQHGGNGVEDFAKEAGLCKQAIFHGVSYLILQLNVNPRFFQLRPS